MVKLKYSLLFIFIFVFSCEKIEQQNFLKINRSWIGLDDFYDFIPQHRFKPLSFEEKQTKINAFIDSRLMIHDAIKNNYHKDPDFVKKMKYHRAELLYNTFFDRIILDTIITHNRLLVQFTRLSPGLQDYYTFDEYRPELKNQLLKIYQKEIQRAYEHYIENLFKDLDFNLFDSTIIDLSQEYAKLYRDNTSDPFAILREIDYKPAIYSINGNFCFVRDVLKITADYPYNIPNNLFHAPTLKSTIETIVLNNIIINNSLKLNIQKDPEFKQKYNNRRNALLYDTYKKRELLEKISVSDDSLRQFYENNKLSLYMTSPRYEVQEIFIKDKTKAERILEQSKNTSDFISLSNKTTERFQSRPNKGYLGFITTEQYAGIGKKAKDTPAGSVFSEIIPSGKGYSIIKVLSVKEPEPLSFDEIISRISADYKQNQYKRIEAELINTLRHKYSYEINLNLLENNNGGI
ncbi:MAG TPA: hypothetical protein DHW42_02720 [Candidatus Marinimicrobia bacterium]|nr:hypothetical protein [Candidatus Neomarinimicrobiota bacterium]